MEDRQGSGREGGERHAGALASWTILGALAVFLFFHVLHGLIDHALAIVLAGVAGIVVGAAGYRWMSGDRSRRAIVTAGALGGGLGLFALHLLPLLH